MIEEVSADLREESFMKDYEIEMKRKDGKKLTFMSAATAVKDDVGQVIEYRGSMRDITEHKRLEQQLLQAQKMEQWANLQEEWPMTSTIFSPQL